MHSAKRITTTARWTWASQVGRTEYGFTLIEALVAMSLMLVVVVGPLAWIVSSITQQNRIASTTFTTRVAEIGMEALTRDLHQAYKTPFGTPSANASTVTITTSGTTTTLSLDLSPTASQPYGQPVTWSCAPSAGCTRTQGTSKRTFFAGLNQITLAGTVPIGLTGATQATNVDPDYVAITVKMNQISQLDSGAIHTVSTQLITVQGGADLRGLA